MRCCRCPGYAPHVTDVQLTRGTTALGQQHFDAICDLYDEVFAEPPMHWSPDQSADHQETLRRLMASPGFGLVLAHAGDELVGFAYGRTLAMDTKWWDNFLEPVPAEVTTERPDRTFAVIDFGVQRSWRGQGLGRRLLDTLLADRPEERATLAVEPAADNSQGFYRHLGWQLVGRLRGAEGDTAPFFDIYALPLLGTSTQTRP